MFQKLQQLVYGDRGAFFFIPKSKESSDYLLGAEAMHLLAREGYSITNSELLLKYPKEFVGQFHLLTNSSNKRGMILRKSFGSNSELEEYTQEEWMVILAMYSIRYGWSEEYREIVGSNPSEITEAYLSDELFSKKFTMPTASKVVQVWGMSELKELMGDIICSKIPLRLQQEESLIAFGEVYPDELALLTNELSERIVIKEILILIAKLTKSSNISIVAFKTIKDVLRFIALSYAHYPIEGQITNRILEKRNYKLATSDKKFIKSQIEALVLAKGFKSILEDMFPNEKFWRRMDNLLTYQSLEKESRKYPNYHALITVLKDSKYDRSWTFNSRFTRSLQEHRYDDAVTVATERAGVFFRHLILFLKMREGEKIPKKRAVEKVVIDDCIEEERLKEQLSQLFSYSPKVEESPSEEIKEYIERDALGFFKSKKFDAFLKKALNPKLGYQVLEEMTKEEHFAPIKKREVQNRHIKYIEPIPALDEQLSSYVSTKIKRVLDSKKYAQNRALGRVYIDDGVAIPLHFSGRNEKSIAFSGSFLPQFTRISIDNLKQEDDDSKEIMRVGVMWKSLSKDETYIDLDHSLFIDDEVCYYGSPTYHSSRDRVVAVSSGDWTYCPPKSSDMFATELVDIDLKEAVYNKNRTITSLVNNYSGKGLNRAEIYFFVTFISKKERVRSGQQIEISLDRVDYAIKLEKSKLRGCFGISLSLEEDILTVLNKPTAKKSYMYTNICNFEEQYIELMDEAKKAPSLAKVLNSVVDRTDKPQEADVVIAYHPEKFEGLKDGVVLLNPLRELERINDLVF